MSFDYTGSFSGSFYGVVTASNGLISSSAQVIANLPSGVVSSSAQTIANLPSGVVSSSTQVTYDGTGLISSSNQISYTGIKNKPTTISAFQKNSITANNRFREVTYPADSSSVSTRLTDLEARTDDTGSDSQTLTFNQVNNNLTISDGNTVDLSALAGGGGGGGSSIWSSGSDYYYVSADLQVTGSLHATSLTGSIDWDNLENVPSGIISGTAQLPSGIVSSSAQTIANLPSGTISGSSQVSYNSISDVPSGILSGSITTSSITNFDTEVSRSVAQAGFGSGGDTIPDGTISSSAQVISSLPSGTISGSSQVDYNSISNVPSGLVSSSTQVVEFGFVENSSTASFITNDDTASIGIQSMSFDSATNALSIEGGNSVDLSSLSGGGGGGGTPLTASDEGGSALSENVRSIDFVGNAVVATGAGNAITVTVNTGSLKSGLISGSSQVSYNSISDVPSDILSSSSQIADDISGSLSVTAIAGLNAGILSGSITTSSITDFNTEVSRSAAEAGFGSGGDTIPDGTISSSAQVISSLPSGVVSGSSQVSYNNISDVPSGILSASSQIADDISGSLSATAISALDAGIVSQSGGIVDLSGVKIQYSNVYSNIGDLPSASDYHGMFAHVHGTGKAYYAHGGNWIELSNSGSDISVNNITNFDTEVSASAAASGFGGGGVSIPDGTISSSAQVVASLPSGTISGSSQVSYDSISDVPSDIVSSSSQIASDISGSLSSTAIAGLGAGILSGSITTSSITNFDTEVSRSAAAAGFGAGGGSDQVFAAGVDITINSGSGTIEISGSEFDGNRTVSNTDLPSGIYNTNFGTSGSLSNFIEKVFFPNTVPTIDQSGFTIQEFEVSGSSIGTLTATDAEGQSVTFRTASSYTDDFFRISSGGAVTLNVQSSESMNTDNTPGSGSHPIQVEAVDTFNGVGSRTIYIRVNPNTAPKWRQTSVGGSVITSFTQSLNEDSTAGNNKVRVYFTDDESDTITINTGSLSSDFSSKFSLDIESTYVQLNQTTASLDYEDITQFEFVLTASDQHYQDGDDVDSIAYLPFQVAVVDNLPPSVNDQTITGVNENSANNANAGSITATDPGNRNTITFTNFTLVEANLDGGSNITSSLGGNSLYDPHSDPFDCSTAGVVTRKSGVYLNSDVANRYIYRVTVSDAFNTTTDTGLITIPIADDAQSTVTDNWTNVYVIESAVDGDSLYINSNGRSGTVARWSSAASQRWEVTSENDLIEVTSETGSSTNLRVKNDVSGSLNSYDGDDRITVRLTASEHGFETTKQYIDLDVRVAINNAPDIIFSNTSANLNTNGARSGSLLTTISFSDAESDTLNHSAFTFTDPSGQLNSVRSGNTYLIQAANNLSGSTTYDITASIQDTHAFRTNTEEHTFTIAQAGIGTLTGDTTSFVISNAVSGAKLQDATGEGNGNDSDLNVSYSPNYNSQAVQSFTSSNAAIAVDNNGGLSMNVDVSSTTSGSGDTINTDITFRDQYGNIGSGSVSVTVFSPNVLVYGYSWDGGGAANEATAIASMGDAGADGDGINSGSVIAHFQSGSIGSSFSPAYGAGGTVTLYSSASLATMSDTDATGISTLGYFNFSSTSQRLLIIFPSSSDQAGKPASMYDGVPPDSSQTANEYYVYAKDAAIPGTIGTGVYYFETETPLNGVSNWGMIFAEGENTNNSRYYLMPDSASAP